jgi:DeoR family fructose operon transcriptional repressor
MYAEERHEGIASLAARRGRVSVSELAATYGVTTETIRRDLDVLERAGVLRRVHGGAVPTSALSVTERGVGERDETMATEKDRIAKAAVDLLPGPGGSVLLDGGTTTSRLARLLPVDSQLTVVTNSVPVAARLAGTSGLHIHMLGGRIRGVTHAAVGDEAVRTLDELRVEVAFLGTNAFDPVHGLTTPHPDEAAVKRAMIRAGAIVVVLADSSKVGRLDLHRFASFDQVDVLVTDAGVDAGALRALRDQGVEVVVA